MQGQSFDTSNGTGAACCPELLGALDDCNHPTWAVDDKEETDAPLEKSPSPTQPRKFWMMRGGNKAAQEQNGSVRSGGSANNSTTEAASDQGSRDDLRELNDLDTDYDMFAASESSKQQPSEEEPPAAPIVSPRGRLKLFGRRGQRQREAEQKEQADREEAMRQKEVEDAHAEMRKSKWDVRTERKELFDPEYQRSKGEEHEVAVLAQSLGISKPTRTLIGGRPSRASACLFPAQDELEAVIIRQGRGRVYECTSHFAANMTSLDRAREHAQQSHLHLLTTGLAMMPRTPEEIAHEAKLAASAGKIKGEKSMGGALFSGSKKLVGGVVHGTTKLVKDTGNMIIGGHQLRLEPISGITAVLDLSLCSIRSIKLVPKLSGEESENDSDDESDQSDSDNAVFAENAICIGADARTYILFFDAHEDKAAWLGSLRATVAGLYHGESLEEKAARVNTVLRVNPQSAAFYGDEDMLDRVIKVAKERIDEPDSFGRYALHYAISMRQNMCLTILLDAGARVDIEDEKGDTLANYAMTHENPRALEMLEAGGLELSKEEKDALESSLALPPKKETTVDDLGNDGTANGAMSDAMRQMNERGEKLDELQNKAGNMKDAAQSYSNFAKELKKKAKEEEQRKIFGIF